MKILTFQYHDHVRKWQLKKMEFSDLTLLVGISGVGKTQILESILNVKKIASGSSMNGVEWDITFSTNPDETYSWKGAFETKGNLLLEDMIFADENEEEDKNPKDKPKIISEYLYKNDQLILERNKDKILFNGKKTPKLSPTASGIYLLRQEDDIQPANQALKQIIRSGSDRGHRLVPDFYFRRMLAKINTLPKIQKNDVDTQIKLALVAQIEPGIFRKIKNRFIEIFPQVTDLQVKPVEFKRRFNGEVRLIHIKEKGVSDWINQFQMSSGMLNALIHIAEMYLWQDGTVILIDEFENSLSVNGIDVLIEDLLQQERNLQFILTSHHPYIINNIDSKYWKIVERKGGRVSTRDAASLGLSESSHEAFIQLIHRDEYREGIAVS